MKPVTNIICIPVWKENSTAHEWLMECAMIAKTKPHMFEKAIIVFDRQQEKMIEADCYWRGGNTAELIGLLELAKMRLYEETTHE